MRLRYHCRDASGSFGVKRQAGASRGAARPSARRDRARGRRRRRASTVERERAIARAGARPSLDLAARRAAARLRARARPRTGPRRPARARRAPARRPRARSRLMRAPPEATGSRPGRIRGRERASRGSRPARAPARASKLAACVDRRAGDGRPACSRSSRWIGDGRSREDRARDIPRRVGIVLQPAEADERRDGDMGEPAAARCRSRACSRSAPSAWPRSSPSRCEPRATGPTVLPGRPAAARCSSVTVGRLRRHAVERDLPAERDGRRRAARARARRPEPRRAQAERAPHVGAGRARLALRADRRSPSGRGRRDSIVSPHVQQPPAVPEAPGRDGAAETANGPHRGAARSCRTGRPPRRR